MSLLLGGILLCLLVSCSEAHLSLNGEWTLSNANGSISCPVTVPGQAHLGLLEAGFIEEPYYRFNDIQQEWVVMEDWSFHRSFILSDTDQNQQTIYLIADGLDTIADVYLNDVPLGRTDNMFLQYVFDISGSVLRYGLSNTLRIDFSSAVTEAKRLYDNYDMTDLPAEVPPNCPPDVYHGYCHVNYLRKAPYSFSWDWGPAFAPQGIWKNISIIAVKNGVIESVSTSITKTSSNSGSAEEETIAPTGTGTGTWTVSVEVDIMASKACGSGSCGGQLTANLGDTAYASNYVTLKAGKNSLVISLEAHNPKLWYPNGAGNQELYPLTVHYYDSPDSDVATSSAEKTIGFRTVELITDALTSSEGKGNHFHFKVNGVPLFMKGANMIPMDSFEGRVSDTDINNILESAVDSNMNVIRNWGGGVYQRDYLYARASELGLLVWEEFMFACSMYPTNEKFLDSVSKETAYQVRRLKHHPAVMLFGGNNENEIALVDNWYGIPDTAMDKYTADYTKLYYETVEPAVKTAYKADTLIFLPSSPSNAWESASNPLATNPGSSQYGDVHFYDYVHSCADVSKFPTPRFVSEYGYQSWPSFATMAAVMDPKQDWGFNTTLMQHRQHHPQGQAQIQAQISFHFKWTGDFNETDNEVDFRNILWMTQLQQALCMKYQTEHYRRSRSIEGVYTMGTIYWQLNDVWQGASWATMEYGGKWKIAQYYMKNIYAPVSAVVIGEKNKLKFYTVNDGSDKMTYAMEYQIYTFDGNKTKQKTKDVAITPSSSQIQLTSDLSSFLENNGCDDVAHGCVLAFRLRSKNDSSIVHENFHLLSKVKYSQVDRLVNPGLKITSVEQAQKANTFTITISKDSDQFSPALFVWLEFDYQNDIPGRFSENGYLLLDAKRKITFTCTNPNIKVADIKSSITVTSLYDIYN